MADSLARAQLARAAGSLHRPGGRIGSALVLLTDDERLRDPARAIAALPRGSLIVVRSRVPARREELAGLVGRAARRKGHQWLIANDAALAIRLGAHGVHFPEQRLAQLAQWRVRRPNWILTCSAHSLGGCLRARQAGAHAVLLSPVLPTASHPLRSALGNLRVRLIALAVPISIYALGGIDARTAHQLSGARLAGLAAVSGNDPDPETVTGRCACPATTV